jgi:hypothetical protein
MMIVRTKEPNKMSERGGKTLAKRQQKCRRGTRSDLTRILETLETLPEIQEELREQRHLLEILTACQAADDPQHGERGSRR